MNRAARRAQAAKGRKVLPRAAVIAEALDILGRDSTASGVTIVMPGGEVTYVSAAAARAVAPRQGARH